MYATPSFLLASFAIRIRRLFPSADPRFHPRTWWTYCIHRWAHTLDGARPAVTSAPAWPQALVTGLLLPHPLCLPGSRPCRCPRSLVICSFPGSRLVLEQKDDALRTLAQDGQGREIIRLHSLAACVQHLERARRPEVHLPRVFKHYHHLPVTLGFSGVLRGSALCRRRRRRCRLQLDLLQASARRRVDCPLKGLVKSGNNAHCHMHSHALPRCLVG